MTNRKTANIFYAVSAVAFAVQCIWSVVGISPFVRIFLFVTVALCLHIGSVVKVSDADEKTKYSVMRKTYFVMFALYLVLFLALVFVDGYYEKDIRNIGHRIESVDEYMDNYVSFLPFRNTRELFRCLKMGWISPKMPLLNIGGNLLLCMPFAFFLPLFFKKQHNFFIFFLTVVGISAMVESTQFLARIGFCDIDDLIFNVAGACVMFGILHTKPLRKLVAKITKLEY